MKARVCQKYKLCTNKDGYSLTAAELEGFLAGVVPESLEPALGASMGEDVEEAQELAVDAT